MIHHHFPKVSEVVGGSSPALPDGCLRYIGDESLWFLNNQDSMESKGPHFFCRGSSNVPNYLEKFKQLSTTGIFSGWILCLCLVKVTPPHLGCMANATIFGPATDQQDQFLQKTVGSCWWKNHRLDVKKNLLNHGISTTNLNWCRISSMVTYQPHQLAAVFCWFFIWKGRPCGWESVAGARLGGALRGKGMGRFVMDGMDGQKSWWYWMIRNNKWYPP